MPIKDPDKRREYQRKYQANWYQRNRARQMEMVAEGKKRKRLWFRQLKAELGLACAECGEDHLACLDFHHDDPKLKEWGVAWMVAQNMGKQRILAEMARCTVLCANCHRKRHWEENGEG